MKHVPVMKHAPLALLAAFLMTGCPPPGSPHTPPPVTPANTQPPTENPPPHVDPLAQPSKPPRPKPRGSLQVQTTSASNRGAVFVGSTVASVSGWLLRWSNDSVHLYESGRGMLWTSLNVRRDFKTGPLLSAGIAPSGTRLCVLASTVTKAAASKAELLAISVAKRPRLLWRKAITYGRHPGVLASEKGCATLLATSSQAQAKPFFYRLFSWAGRRLLDSGAMQWQHHQIAAIQPLSTGRYLISMNTSGQSSTLVELLSLSDFSATFSLSVDCALVARGQLHLRGGGLDQRHFRWIKSKSGLPVVGNSTRCAKIKGGRYAPALGRRLRDSRGAATRVIALESVGPGDRIGDFSRALATRNRLRLHPSARDRHVDSGKVLLTDNNTVYRWDLKEGRIKRLLELPAGRYAPASFIGKKGDVLLRKKVGSRFLLTRYASDGKKRAQHRLQSGDRLLVKPDGQSYVMRKRKLPLSPSDVHWFKNAEDDSDRLLGYESLSGIFTIDPVKNRLLERCCRRQIGQGGIFGATLAPNKKQLAAVFTGKKPELRFLTLSDLKEARPSIALADRRNDYARLVWLDAARIAVIRDARFIGTAPTVALLDIAKARIERTLRFADRGPVFYDRTGQRFYQLLADRTAVAFFGLDGRHQRTVGIIDSNPYSISADGSYSCLGAACGALRCRPPRSNSAKPYPLEKCPDNPKTPLRFH
jgi:hypothetical protein